MSPTPPRLISPWGYSLGLTIAFLATFGAWYDPASFARVNAWHIGLWQNCDVPHPAFKLLSFGLAAFLVIVLGWLCKRAENVRGMFTVASILVFLAVSCFVQLALTRASWLESAIEGAADFQNTMYFANKLNAPLGFDSLPDNGITLKQEGISDRLFAARFCLSYGWMAYLFGSLWALATAWRGLAERPAPPPRGLRLRWIFALILLLQAVFPFEGQIYTIVGDRAAAADRVEAAESYYRKAIACDEWYQLQPSLFLKIGELRHSRGDDSSPSARLYLGEENATNGFFLKAMDLLESADVSQDPAISHVLCDEIAQLATIQGEIYYNQAELGAARHEWERAVEAKPQQVAIYYMLGQVNFDLANYPEARGWYDQGKRQSGITVSQAVMLAGTGDSYYHDGEPGIARSYYERSFSTYYENNFRSVKSLVDDYFR